MGAEIIKSVEKVKPTQSFLEFEAIIQKAMTIPIRHTYSSICYTIGVRKALCDKIGKQADVRYT